jgi:hypothetical protein
LLVDLYAVVRQAMRVGHPNYSIKSIEAFYMNRRDTEVAEGGDSIVAFERFLETGDEALLESIERYNTRNQPRSLAEQRQLPTSSIAAWIAAHAVSASLTAPAKSPARAARRARRSDATAISSPAPFASAAAPRSAR